MRTSPSAARPMSACAWRAAGSRAGSRVPRMSSTPAPSASRAFRSRAPAVSGSAIEVGAVTDQTSLLNQLKLEREPPPAPRARRTWVVAGGAFAVAIVIAGAAAAFALRSAPSGAKSQAGVAAVAETAPPRAPTVAAPTGSILDASGYVVARRQATVSAKITGKVVAVLIEEGQRVEAGEVIARLDAANASAQVAQATAQLEQ